MPIFLDPGRPSFLTHEEVPPNVLGLKVGDPVEVLNPRVVTRVGYPLSLSDARHAVEQVWSLDADAALAALLGAVAIAPPVGGGLTLRGHSPRVLRAMKNALAYAYLEFHDFGGVDRGVEVQPAPWAAGKVLAVTSKRTVYVGKYYAPTYWRDAWTGECDYQPGGLSPRRAVVLIGTDLGEFMSGDLSRKVH